MHFTFTALDHVKKMNKRCVLVLSGASLFVGGEDVRRGSFCNKRTRFATFMLKAESSGCLKRVSMGWWLLRRGGGGTWVVFRWVCAAEDSKLAPRSKKKTLILIPRSRNEPIFYIPF